jgi:hypothetical protein
MFTKKIDATCLPRRHQRLLVRHHGLKILTIISEKKEKSRPSILYKDVLNNFDS